MKSVYFFGYGSLVNRATHAYPQAAPAVATGWRRVWIQTPARQHAYLSAVRAPGHRIDGLIAAVPGSDWAALDAREAAYDRISDTANIAHRQANVDAISIYAVSTARSAVDTVRNPILLSYLDVVLQGYLREFGEGGAESFIASTDGWDAPVLDDRAAPIYPRHQRLDRSETAFVDDTLDRIGARRIGV